MRMTTFKNAAFISICGTALFLSGCGGGTTESFASGSGSLGATSQSIDTGFVVSGRSIYEQVAPEAQLTSSSSTSRTPAALLGNKLYIRGVDYGSAAIGQGSNESPLAAISTPIW
jgi:hypothetical protein